jgi:hypothetical protein
LSFGFTAIRTLRIRIAVERITAVTMPSLVVDDEKTDVELRQAKRAVAEAVPDAGRQMLKGQTIRSARRPSLRCQRKSLSPENRVIPP